MDFIKKRIKQYQEKKLNDALSKIEFHLNMKEELMQRIKVDAEPEVLSIRREINFHNNMIKIWEDNAKKIKNEMTKILD